MVSFAEEVTQANLTYGDDLEDLVEVARPLLARSAPTVVVSGHIHMRHACAAGNVLQLSCAALVEPPFEITLLDFEIDTQVRGDRMVVRRRSEPLVSPSAVKCPVLSPPRQEWVFEAGGVEYLWFGKAEAGSGELTDEHRQPWCATSMKEYRIQRFLDMPPSYAGVPNRGKEEVSGSTVWRLGRGCVQDASAHRTGALGETKVLSG
jgi:hypothetical protein